MSRLSTAVKRHPLIGFFVLAYALSWWPWILYAYDLAPTPLVGFGPFLAALVVLAITGGKTGVLGLLRRMVLWRVGLGWYAAALLIPVAISLGCHRQVRKHSDGTMFTKYSPQNRTNLAQRGAGNQRVLHDR